MIPPDEFTAYICEECPKAFITYSLEVGSHLECSLPDRIFANGNDLRSSCPQFRNEPPEMIIQNGLEKLWNKFAPEKSEEFISVEEMTI